MPTWTDLPDPRGVLVIHLLVRYDAKMFRTSPLSESYFSLSLLPFIFDGKDLV